MPEDARPLVSVIVPVFNEEENVARCYEAVRVLFADIVDRYRCEIFFSDNHSTDRTFEILCGIASRDPDVRVIRLARNYGFQRSLMTAYRSVAGAAAIQIDADLQDPPELILDFLKHWEDGHDVVVGLRVAREEPKWLEFLRRRFYRLLRRISDDGMLDDAGDFRLVSRSVLDRLARVHDAYPYTRGLVSSFAARQIGVPYRRSARRFGQSKFPIRRLFSFAMDGIINHSVTPLRIATWVGLVTFVFTLGLLLYYLVAFAASGGTWPAGFATQTLLLLASIALNAIMMGIIGEYLGRVYREVRIRPLTVIEAGFNVDLDRIEKALMPGPEQ